MNETNYWTRLAIESHALIEFSQLLSLIHSFDAKFVASNRIELSTRAEYSN